MRRNHPAIYSLLEMIDEGSDSEGGVIFTDEYFDMPEHGIVKVFLPLLLKSELVIEQLTPDLPEYKTYRVTWKGHCYMDLFSTYAEQVKNFGPASLQSLFAEAALKSFC